MDKDRIKNELQMIFQDVFDDNSIVINEGMTAKDIKDWDSFNHVRLIVSVEEHFKITMATSEVMDLSSVGDLIGLIQKYTSNGNRC